MTRRKKTQTQGKESSLRPKRTAVVWIAPDLERITKGERGRRGLADPTSGYYLRLADVALRGTQVAGSKASQPMSSALSEDEMLFSMPFPLGPESDKPLPSEAKRSNMPRSKRPKPPLSPKQPRVEVPRQTSLEHPKLALPRLQPAKPPKFDPPKPPKAPRKPKPPRQAS
jgi:hypothetical protein